MAKFLFAVSGQYLDLLTNTKGVADTINANYAEFDFRSPEWEGVEKWAHFTCPDFQNGAIQSFNLVDDKISPERGLNLPAGIWEVYLTGEVLANVVGEAVARLVTTTQTIQIITSNINNSLPLSELMISVAEQIDAKATAALNARITAATADIDGDVGTPTCDVEITGEDRTKSLDFHFHNLRGDVGPTGHSGVYIGHEEPTDPEVNVWIDPLGLVGKVISDYEFTGSHTPGTYDHLVFSFSDNTTLDVPIYNGADGTGVGDMVKNVYDPNNVASDIFAYVTNAISALSSTLATVATSGSYTDLLNKPVIDSALSGTSTNAVQNKVVKDALDAKQDALTIDTEMSGVSTNPVQNQAIKAYVDANAGKPFIAEYGTTTLAQITAALNAGKEVICKRDSSAYGTLITATASGATFGRMTFAQNYLYNVDSSDQWTEQTTQFLQPGNVDTVVSDNSNNPIANSSIKNYVDTKRMPRLRTEGVVINTTSFTIPANSYITLYASVTGRNHAPDYVVQAVGVTGLGDGQYVRPVEWGVSFGNGDTATAYVRLRNDNPSAAFVSPTSATMPISILYLWVAGDGRTSS